MIINNKMGSPVSPSDADFFSKTIAWGVLQDAVCKSCLTNDPSKGRVITPSPSNQMLKYFVESREWIMAMGGNVPDTDIGDGMSAGFECGFCVDLLANEIGDREVFGKFIRGMWRDWDKKIIDKVTHIKRRESARLAEHTRERMTEAGRKRPGKPRGGDGFDLASKALRVISESRKWRA